MIRILIAVCGLLIPVTAIAQTPLDWHMHVSALDAGDEVDVRLLGGSSVRGRVVSVDSESITVKTRGHQIRVVAGTVGSVERTDRVRNGAAIGFVTGFTAGAVMMSTCEPGFLCEHTPQAILACGGLAGAFGSGVGILIDAIVRGDRTVFRRSDASRVRLAPTLGGGRKGLSVRFSF